MGSKVLSFNEAPAKRGGKCSIPLPTTVTEDVASMRPPRNAGESKRIVASYVVVSAASMRPPRNAGESGMERVTWAARY